MRARVEIAARRHVVVVTRITYDAISSTTSGNGNTRKLTEVALALFQRRHDELVRTFIDLLVVALVTHKEKQLVTVAVEVGPWQQNGPAYIAAGIVVLALRPNDIIDGVRSIVSLEP